MKLFLFLCAVALCTQSNTRILSAQEIAATALRPHIAEYRRTLQPTAVQETVFDPTLIPFYHGVASGDPLHDRVMLWTRVTPTTEETVSVQWKIATDTALAHVVNSGTVTTSALHDYTVKVDATGLQPNTTYYYGFTALGKHSLTGRTKTAPTDGVPSLRFGVASCANYQQGYFNAYATMAERNDLDAVVFLGDYIYEYEEGGYGYSEQVGRGHAPKHEITTLDDYRIRHAFYKLDPALRRVHQQFPFIAVWDDHESSNDSYKDGAQNHQPDKEGEWENRKHSSVQAYFEWMPIRQTSVQHPNRVFRTFSYGTLVDLLMLDTRLEGRSKQLDSLTGPDLYDTTRSLLGQEQLAWFLQQLSASQARWKVVGNQVMLAPVRGFGNPDAWDGYPRDRDAILSYLQHRDIRNVVFLTGDIHSSWASDIARNVFDTADYTPSTGKGSLAVEFVTPSISSANLNELMNKPPRSPESIGTEALLQGGNKHFKYIELDSHGYTVLSLDSTSVQTDWFYADTILIERKAEHFAEAYRVENNTGHLVRSTAPAPRGREALPAPLYPPQPTTSAAHNEQATSPFLFISSYPNPFATHIVINYAVNTPSAMKIALYSSTGETISTLVDGVQQAGVYAIGIDATALASGVYICRMQCNGTALTRTIVKQ